MDKVKESFQEIIDKFSRKQLLLASAAIVVIVVVIIIIKKKSTEKIAKDAGVKAATEAIESTNLPEEESKQVLDAATDAAAEVAAAPIEEAEQITTEVTEEAERAAQTSAPNAPETFVIARACQEAFYNRF
jgi:cell envelope opacity-associated protein A